MSEEIYYTPKQKQQPTIVDCCKLPYLRIKNTDIQIFRIATFGSELKVANTKGHEET